MRYEFQFYTKDLYGDLLELARESYKWEMPVVGISRVEFSNSLNKIFCDSATAWEKTVGCYLEKGKLIACVWNEGCYDGTQFFLFDSKQRAMEEDLLVDMIKFAKTYGAGYKKDGRTRFVNLFIPEWNDRLQKAASEHGFKKGDWKDNINIFSFTEKRYEVKLPEGYSIVDGNTTSTFSLANVHRHSFGYGEDDRATEHGWEAFEAVRQTKYYQPELELCVLDKEKRPVAMGMIWYDEDMPYCELEPLAVCWWERRKGIGTALLGEAYNRILERYPNCKGIKGGDQPFYQSIGYETKAAATAWYWAAEIFISWEEASVDKNYTKEVE